MPKIECQLTVYFEDPFWIGVYERKTDGMLEVSKITFGSEPRDYEVYAFLLGHWTELRFSPPLAQEKTQLVRKNPKRMQREIHQQTTASGVGTKAQQALKLQQETNKMQRKQNSKEQREAEKQEQFERRQQKRKEKHKGH